MFFWLKWFYVVVICVVFIIFSGLFIDMKKKMQQVNVDDDILLKGLC